MINLRMLLACVIMSVIGVLATYFNSNTIPSYKFSFLNGFNLISIFILSNLSLCSSEPGSLVKKKYQQSMC